MGVEPLNQKSLERVVSQKVVQMGNSYPCQIFVVGFLSVVCITSLFMAVYNPIGAFEFGGGRAFSAFSTEISTSNSSSSETISMVTSGECYLKPKERGDDSKKNVKSSIDNRVSLLYSSWSALLNESVNIKTDFFENVGFSKSNVPNAPHLENCKLSSEVNERLDNRLENQSFPTWTLWKGLLDVFPFSGSDDQLRYHKNKDASEGTYPPWITGSDEENYPLTREVQSHLWIHQHPVNCSNSRARFLVANWERRRGLGIGGQFNEMCGLLAIAINEKRVLITNDYNRADHDGCQGLSRSSWSCYFFPETTQECRDRAFELMGSKEAWKKGIITTKRNYTLRQIWHGRIPGIWGNPWNYLQPTTEINGSLVASHRKMDQRWWRAQALRYLMRFQTEYTCNLLNGARHAAFGWEAAKMVLATPSEKWPKYITRTHRSSDIEQFVWSNHKPWIPRPLLSMHVRMGDKAREMKIVGFEEYMRLAERIRNRFPNLNNIWLSTEMQEVIDKSRSYPHWKFYYTNVTRQVGNTAMASYEASLGRETSTNYPFVNFLMATDADFFVGALGSSWCYLIDGMRNTGGKVMAGYLSVNKDRYW